VTKDHRGWDWGSPADSGHVRDSGNKAGRSAHSIWDGNLAEAVGRWSTLAPQAHARRIRCECALAAEVGKCHAAHRLESVAYLGLGQNPSRLRNRTSKCAWS